MSPAILRLPLAIALVSFGATACGRAPETNGEDPDDPSVRIRAVLGSDEAPGETVRPASEPAEGSGGAEEDEAPVGGATPVLALHTGDTVHLGDEVRAFYRQRDFEPAWTDREGFLDRTEQLLAAVHGAGSEGLDVETYHRGVIHELVDRARREHEQGLPVGYLLGTLDMLLTESFLRLSTDLGRGTLDPSEAELSWSIPRGDPTDVAFLDRALEESGDVERALDEVRPTAPFYGRLRATLSRYQAVVDSGGWPAVEPGDALEEGSQGPRVLQLRARLKAEGDPVELPLVAAGSRPEIYDADLARAVESFQRRHGLEPDGTVGEATREALAVPASERLAALRINLDRWRWLPRELGERYVLVNVAGFQMAVMEGDTPALEMNVVVGQEAWKTPIFQDTLEYVVVNPYWNVPESIAEDELLPAIARDPGYLERNDYEVVERGGQRTFRQRPGRGNALGKVKFLFPNANNVYLHDTPADHLFSRASRAFSHGCIRLEEPEELARYLLETSTSKGGSSFDELLATGEEQWVPLDEKLPVYILYFTAWADETGSVSFYDDVYRRDAEVKRYAAEGLEGSGLRPPRAAPLRTALDLDGR